MYYYEVYVAEQRYQKREPLTYASEQELGLGVIVRVPYGKRTVAGFVTGNTSKPSFQTKTIAEVVSQIPLPETLRKLHSWMLDFYPAGSGSITLLFIPSDIKASQKSTPTQSKAQQPVQPLPSLTKQQQQAIEAIEKDAKRNFLLHGETGSGKTRVYIERARNYLSHTKSVIILTPEISLIPQLAQTFLQSTDRPVFEMHSGLTKAQRNKNWRFILEATEPVIIIGTRSAIFAPVSNVGFIAIDEMHEPAYKQDSAPYYYALRVAAKRALIETSEIIYGSATPPITEYFMAQHASVPILRLDETAKKSQRPNTQIIDIKDKGLFSRHRYISDQLLAVLEDTLSRKEQSLLFLNRRGTARQILCQDCGWQALCPKCDLPLTLHADTHHVRCHTCGWQAQPPLTCPSCGGGDILYRSLGTKALSDDLQKLFPEARIQRFDTDNTAAETLHRNFDAVHSGEIDIIIGTQMLGKGLDLPQLSLVGIINADTALHMPDFSSAERGYQLLHQALGRVGRGHKNGQIILQTFQPDDTLVQAAANQAWLKLYEHELSEREKFLFPPFCHLLKITVSRRTSKSAEDYITTLATLIKNLQKKVEIEAPAPSFHERSHGNYNWQIVIKARSRTQLTDIVRELPAGNYSYDLDPMNLL